MRDGRRRGPAAAAPAAIGPPPRPAGSAALLGTGLDLRPQDRAAVAVFLHVGGEVLERRAQRRDRVAPVDPAVVDAVAEDRLRLAAGAGQAPVPAVLEDAVQALLALLGLGRLARQGLDRAAQLGLGVLAVDPAVLR